MVRLSAERRPYLNYISSSFSRSTHPYLELLIILQHILTELWPVRSSKCYLVVFQYSKPAIEEDAITTQFFAMCFKAVSTGAY